uniref:Novel immune-type receptor 12b n=1 Tax=Ictalurus punctatus TaxID=7998 RepID=A4UU49_ICTPU|nr:novel immune-type receptor 12b precursor [Ictalurus punctatus]ABP02018.1 novel immune-type receptor 12b [Ictalurus punctatus]
MVHFTTLPLFLCTVGLISETLCSLTLEAEAGDNVTIWCQHGLTNADKIYWFKHTSDSVPLLLGCKQFFTSSPSENCYFFTESERIVMSVHGKNASLTITAVNVSDTGLYYCSFSEKMFFSNSTSLQVKGDKTDRHDDEEQESDSVNYAALHFSNKKTKRPGRRSQMEDPHVIYSGIKQ